MLLARGARLVLTGSADDREEAEAIAARLPASSFLQLAGRTTVGELAAVLRRLRLLVAVDSGPAHMAAALGTPLVVLWGPAILEQVRPISSTTPIRIVRHRVFCAPCYGTPMMKTCQRNICMEAISPERVLAEAVALLDPPSEPRA
jgi:ADP-heptose:LPS heptosyltransferase